MFSAIYWTLVHTDQTPLEHMETFLSNPEIRRLDGMRFPKRREEWLLGRWASKRLIQSILPYQNYPLNKIEIHNSPDGAPYILQPGGSTLSDSLSISHSHRFALCALAPGHGLRIGVDLEAVEPRSQAIMTDYFTAAEQEMAECYPAALRYTVVNLIWSMKESMLKALGVGLHWDTRKVEVREIESLFPPDGEPGGWQRMQIRDDQNKDRCWAGWWQCHRDFVITLAGFTTSPADLQSIHLVQKWV